MESKINPKPQYQRGEVWKLPAQQLLIDTILCGFDIPKVYLHDMRGTGLYDYDVTDGQQRLRALWAFLKDGYRLADTSYQRSAPWRTRLFSELPTKLKRQIERFKLVLAIISDTSNDEVRELFSRLQRGSRLTPPELRNSIPSQIGDAIRAIADNHPFFTDADCPFPGERFQHQDLCAHAFAIELYRGARDLKAPTLKAMYDSVADHVPGAVAKKVQRVLDFMHKMQVAQPRCIRTKWGFVDLFWVISELQASLPADEELARRYVQFEARRREYTAKPELLILRRGSKPAPPRNRRLYEYIAAFKTSGGLADNVRKRYAVLVKELA